MHKLAWYSALSFIAWHLLAGQSLVEVQQCALRHTETHSAQECCGFAGALYRCLVSCAGSGSVWALELMVSRFLYPTCAECCMLRPRYRRVTTLSSWLHCSKLRCIQVEWAPQQNSRRGLSFEVPNNGKSRMFAKVPTVGSCGFRSTTDTLGSSSGLLPAPQIVQECCACPCAAVSAHDTM